MVVAVTTAAAVAVVVVVSAAAGSAWLAGALPVVVGAKLCGTGADGGAGRCQVVEGVAAAS